jgi:hypothetical protein
MVLKRIGVWSVARILGIMYASIGFVGGLFFACISLLGFGVASGMRDSDVPAWLGTAFGMAAIVVFPIIYGVLGLIGGALTAALYNLFSATVGGVELDLQSSSS